MHVHPQEWQPGAQGSHLGPVPSTRSASTAVREAAISACYRGETARPAPVLTSRSLRSAGPRGGQGAIHAESCTSKTVGAQRMPRRPHCSLNPGVDSSPVSSSTEPCCADLRGRSVATVVHDAWAGYTVWGAGESGLWWRKHVRRQPLREQPLLRGQPLRWRHVRRRQHVRRHVRRHERWRHVWRRRRAFWRLRHERAGRQGPAIRDAEHRADAGARRAHSLTPSPSRARASGYRDHSSHTALPTPSSAPRPLSWAWRLTCASHARRCRSVA